MSGIFCELPWRPFLPDSSRPPFIGFGVDCIATPCNEQPFASFLMLSIKASIHWCWWYFSCDAGWQTAFVSFLTLTHLDDGPRFGLRQSYYKFRWYLNLGGRSLELVYMDIHNQPTELALSKSFFDQRSHIPAMALLQASILHSSTGTSHSSKLSTNSRILFKSSQDLPIFLFDNYKWSLASTILLLPHGINVPD